MSTLLALLLAAPLFWSVPKATTRAALLAHGWTPEAVDWIDRNVRVEYDVREATGGFAPSRNPLPGLLGRITVAPDLPAEEEALTIEEEAHHAWDTGHGWTVDGVRADLTRLANGPDDVYWRARHEARLVLRGEGDAAHDNHRLIERLGFDYTLLPPDYRARWFGYSETATPTPQRHRVWVPVS